MAIINRKRFNYKFKMIFKYLFKCLCCRNIRLLKENREVKKHFYFEKAEEKLLKELDVIHMLKSIRRLKLVANAILS